MGFSRQEYWSGLPCPPPGDLPNPGIKPVSLTSPELAGVFFTASATWEALVLKLPPIKNLLYYDLQKLDLCCVSRTTGKEDLDYKEQRCHLNPEIKGVVLGVPGLRMEEVSENRLDLGWLPLISLLRSPLVSGVCLAPSFLRSLGFQLTGVSPSLSTARGSAVRPWLTSLVTGVCWWKALNQSV